MRIVFRPEALRRHFDRMAGRLALMAKAPVPPSAKGPSISDQATIIVTAKRMIDAGDMAGGIRHLESAILSLIDTSSFTSLQNMLVIRLVRWYGQYGVIEKECAPGLSPERKDQLSFILLQAREVAAELVTPDRPLAMAERAPLVAVPPEKTMMTPAQFMAVVEGYQRRVELARVLGARPASPPAAAPAAAPTAPSAPAPASPPAAPPPAAFPPVLDRRAELPRRPVSEPRPVPAPTPVVEDRAARIRRLLEEGNEPAIREEAFLLERDGRFQDAVRLFEHLVQRDSDNMRYRHALGRVLRRLDRDGDALPHYLKIRELDPSNREIRNTIIILYYRTGRRQDQLREVLHLLRENREDRFALEQLGHIFLHRNEFLKADAVFRYLWDTLKVKSHSVEIGLEVVGRRLGKRDRQGAPTAASVIDEVLEELEVLERVGMGVDGGKTRLGDIVGDALRKAFPGGAPISPESEPSTEPPGSSAGEASAPPALRDHLEKARDALSRRQVGYAIAELLAARRLDAANVEITRLEDECLSALQQRIDNSKRYRDWKAVRDLCQKALLLRPEDDQMQATLWEAEEWLSPPPVVRLAARPAQAEHEAAAAPPVPPPSEPSERIAERRARLVEVAKRQTDRGDYAGAAETYSALLKLEPHHVEFGCYQALCAVRARFPFVVSATPKAKFFGDQWRVVKFARRLVRMLEVVRFLKAHPLMSSSDIKTLSPTIFNLISGIAKWRVFDGIHEAQAAAGIIQDPITASRLVGEIQTERDGVLGITLEGEEAAATHARPASDVPARPTDRSPAAIDHGDDAPETRRKKAIAFLVGRRAAGLSATVESLRESGNADLVRMAELLGGKGGDELFRRLLVEVTDRSGPDIEDRIRRERRVQKLLADGSAALERNEFAAAASAYHNLLVHAPEHAAAKQGLQSAIEGLIRKGRGAHMARDWAGVIANLEPVIDLTTKQELREGLADTVANAYLELGDEVKAQQVLSKARPQIVLAPEPPAPLPAPVRQDAAAAVDEAAPVKARRSRRGSTPTPPKPPLPAAEVKAGRRKVVDWFRADPTRLDLSVTTILEIAPEIYWKIYDKRLFQGGSKEAREAARR